MPSGVFSLKQLNQALQQGAWTNQKPLNVDYLVVAGGGGSSYTGGGGAGGLLQGNISVPTGSAITVTVGAGGSAANGSNSVFGSLTAIGGGAYGSSGGSGGGSGYNYSGGQGVAGQGNAGARGVFVDSSGSGEDGGGGGGGAGTPGLIGVANVIGGKGGSGIASDISGTRTAYAGGGGGLLQNSTNGGAGGVGGGGNGGTGTAGAANTGGGAGGPGSGGSSTGGSGIVIISYPDIYQAAASTTGSPTISTSGSGSILFNSAQLAYGGNSSLSLGTSDFTIEFFVNNQGSTADNGVFQTNSIANFPTNTSGLAVGFSGGNFVVYAAGGQTNSTTSVSNSTWYHCALVRSSSVTKLYVNGTATNISLSDTTNYTQTYCLLGAYYTTSYPCNAYVSNFRILKGTALYTSNFTAPTAPLTAISNTALLLNTISGSYTADTSVNGYAPTVVNGATTWNSASPFATGLGYKNRVYTWTSSGSITF